MIHFCDPLNKFYQFQLKNRYQNFDLNSPLNSIQYPKYIQSLYFSKLLCNYFLQKIIKKLYDAEMLILKTRSLRHKLYERKNLDTPDEELETFIQDLLVKVEVPIKGGANSRIGKSLMQLLKHQKVK